MQRSIMLKGTEKPSVSRFQSAEELEIDPEPPFKIGPMNWPHLKVYVPAARR